MVTYRKDEKQRPEGWNAGAPPHVGWWAVHASWGVLGDFHAWWDGSKWSKQTCSHDEDASYATKNLGTWDAGCRKEWSSWSWLWPENARVARVNPETGEVTGSGPCPYETDGKVWPFGEVKEKAADAPELKKKQAGNRKVTRYVVMVGYGLGTTYPAATFECKKNAVEYIEREARSGRYETIYIDAIRFRTPE